MVLIGPKDLPVAVRAVADMVKKARRMAGEFQGHVDEMMKDSNLKEVRDSISEIRRMDIAGDIRRHVDSDGSLRAALTDDPFAPSPNLQAGGIASTPLAPPLAEGGAATEQGSVSIAPPAPAFIPPGMHPEPAHETIAGVIDAAPTPAFTAPAFIPPAFIPPAAATKPVAAHPDH